MLGWLRKRFDRWLAQEMDANAPPLCDFERLRRVVRPGDVVLVEGGTRLSGFIKNITQSQWTHSALYVGYLHEIEDEGIRWHIRRFYDGDLSEPLLIEGLIGQGIIVAPLSRYRNAHLRVCQPRGLSSDDAYKVIGFAVRHLGVEYDVRQLFDLARLMSPYSILPRRWRSSLFDIRANISHRTICSTLIAAAFESVNFPVLPVARRSDDGGLRLYPRNVRLCIPRDFDYSPYFDVVKCPLLALDDVGVYRHLPWDNSGAICNDENDCVMPMVRASSLAANASDDATARNGMQWRSRRARRHRVIVGATKT